MITLRSHGKLLPKDMNFFYHLFQNNMKRMKHENLVTSMMTDMSPGTRKFLNIPVAVMEVLPPLMNIIQPNFRPVSNMLGWMGQNILDAK